VVSRPFRIEREKDGARNPCGHGDFVGTPLALGFREIFPKQG
jgi:hypothetical protein